MAWPRATRWPEIVLRLAWKKRPFGPSRIGRATWLAGRRTKVVVVVLRVTVSTSILSRKADEITRAKQASKDLRAP